MDNIYNHFTKAQVQQLLKISPYFIERFELFLKPKDEGYGYSGTKFGIEKLNPDSIKTLKLFLKHNISFNTQDRIYIYLIEGLIQFEWENHDDDYHLLIFGSPPGTYKYWAPKEDNLTNTKDIRIVVKKLNLRMR